MKAKKKTQKLVSGHYITLKNGHRVMFLETATCNDPQCWYGPCSCKAGKIKVFEAGYGTREIDIDEVCKYKKT